VHTVKEKEKSKRKRRATTAKKEEIPNSMPTVGRGYDTRWTFHRMNIKSPKGETRGILGVKRASKKKGGYLLNHSVRKNGPRSPY